jgi:hypothetical protein
VVQPAGDDLAGWVGEQLPDHLDDCVQHLLAVLLHPPLSGMAVHLVAARLGDRLQALVEERGLDAGRPLVDAEQEPLGHGRDQPRSNMRRRS